MAGIEAHVGLPPAAPVAEMEVVPGERLGCFVLGMGVNDALQVLRKGFVPLRPRVEVRYSAKRPLDSDIVLRVPEFGLQLRFESRSQRLRAIDVFELGRVQTVYSGQAFGGANRAASFLNLYRVFGPTFPGKFDAEAGVYVLRYQGLCLMFPLPQDLHEAYANSDELPLELPSGGSPEASRMMLYAGFEERNPQLVQPSLDSQAAVAALLPQGLSLSTLKPAYLEEVCFKIPPGPGARVSSPTLVQFLRRHRTLHIGSCVQDALSELGEPDRVYFKQDNRMNIHAASSASAAAPIEQPHSKHGVSLTGAQGRDARGASALSPGSDTDSDPDLVDDVAVVGRLAEHDPQGCFASSDYFYNYFGLGLDLLFDARTHRLKKVIAHTNLPGHSLFSMYNRCEFRALVSVATSTPPQPAPSVGADLANGLAKSGSSVSSSAVVIKPDMSWPEVQALLGPAGRPMIHDSGIVANPFGATLLYAYDGCVFEVSRSGHIVSLTIF